MVAIAAWLSGIVVGYCIGAELLAWDPPAQMMLYFAVGALGASVFGLARVKGGGG